MCLALRHLRRRMRDNVVSTAAQIRLPNPDTGRFSRPGKVRRVSVPSGFQPVIFPGFASQTNQAGTSPLKPAIAPPPCVYAHLHTGLACFHRGVPPAGFSHPVNGRTGRCPLTHSGQVREEVSFSVANAILDKTSGTCSQRHCDPHWLHTHISHIGTLYPTFP